MTKTEFISYKNVFIEPTREILSQDKSPSLYESAFPAYANPNPVISFLFWQRVRKVMQYLETTKPFNQVLDFGCGGGVMLPFLSQNSTRVFAYDIDLDPIKKMQHHIQFPDAIEIIDGQQRSLESLPSASFEVILALDVLEHVEDLEGTIRKLAALLVPGGEIILCGPTENVFYQIGRKIAGKDYSGDYHVSNIYNIKDILATVAEVNTLATLYYPMTFFKIYRGVVH
jgi:2-polyprenyl-3-methyl-5-hydroxy-6-metoxy-1,4-benzoquinol methylase